MATHVICFFALSLFVSRHLFQKHTDIYFLSRHVQLDLSIHVLGTLPKIPYPDTKVFSLAAACGLTCSLNIWTFSWQIIHAGHNEPRPAGPMSLYQQLFRFGWTHGITNKSAIITTTQIATCVFCCLLLFEYSFWKICGSLLLPTPLAGTE